MNKPRPTRKLAELTAEFMADAFKKQGFARTELVTRWKAIAGAEIAAWAEPIKLQWPRARDGEEPEPATLVLRVEGPAALEILCRGWMWPELHGVLLIEATLRDIVMANHGPVMAPVAHAMLVTRPRLPLQAGRGKERQGENAQPDDHGSSLADTSRCAAR